MDTTQQLLDALKQHLELTDEEATWIVDQGTTLANNMMGNLNTWVDTYGHKRIEGLLAVNVATTLLHAYMTAITNDELVRLKEDVCSALPPLSASSSIT